MQIKPNSFSIVLLGKWNPYILNPQWISKNLFDDTPNVQIEFSLNLDLPNRFRIQNIVVTPTPDKVIFIAADSSDASLLQICDIAIKLCSILSHTPLAAVGVNFEYVVGEDFGDLLEKLGFNKNEAFIDDEWDIQRQGFSRSLKKDNYFVNFTATLTQKDGLNFKFNYHYNLNDSRDRLKEILRDKTAVDYKNNSLSLLNSIYNLKLEQND